MRLISARVGGSSPPSGTSKLTVAVLPAIQRGRHFFGRVRAFVSAAPPVEPRTPGDRGGFGRFGLGRAAVCACASLPRAARSAGSRALRICIITSAARSADDDGAFCRSALPTRRLTLPCDVAHADVPAEARRHGMSLEVAGRHARLGSSIAGARAVSEQSDALPLAHTRGRPGGDGAAAPGARRRYRRARRRWRRAAAIASGRFWSEPRRSCRRCSRAGRDLAGGRDQRRSCDPAEPHPPRSAAAAASRKSTRRCCAGTRRRIPARRRRIAGELANAEVPQLRPARTRWTVDHRRRRSHKLPVALARRVVRYALETADPDRAYG